MSCAITLTFDIPNMMYVLTHLLDKDECHYHKCHARDFALDIDICFLATLLSLGLLGFCSRYVHYYKGFPTATDSLTVW